ncbi:hypothetical protein J6590_108137 [Homalodisca vitripennis]|nr:hypothetical protein J6590_108137 [Homalodisca vitripennis]
MKCKSWGRQREIGNDKCSQKLCSKTSIRFWSPNIPGTRETQKRRPRPSPISIGRLSSRPLVRPREEPQIDNIMESLIISVGSDTDSSDSDPEEEDNLSGIEELQ